MATFVLEIVTPDKTVLKEEVESAVCPGVMGEFGILPNHAPILSALKIGPLHYQVQDKREVLFISGGFLDMNNNICSVLAESAERAADIDVERAIEAKKRAQMRLEAREEAIDEARATLALQRAIMRISIANKEI